MHQESFQSSTDDKGFAFEEEKRRTSIAKGKEHVNSTFTLSTANTPPQSAGNTPTDSDDDIPKDGVFSTNSFDDENTDTEEGGAADYNKMDPTIDVTSTPTLRIHKIHPQSQIIGKSTAGVQTRRKLKEKEPKKVSQALADESWVEAMQEELLQFKLQDVWVLCDLPEGKRVIGTKLGWFRNKRMKELPELKQSDSFWLLHPSWALRSIRWMSKVAMFIWAISQKRGVVKNLGLKILLIQQWSSRVFKALYGLQQAPRACMKDFTFLLNMVIGEGLLIKLCLLRGIEEISCWYSPLQRFSLHAVKRIFSDYAGDNHDRRSTSGGCQYLGRRLVSWQCKKQTIVAISSTEAEYVAAAVYVLRTVGLQNQCLIMDLIS
ncbi:hypothetical protein Tco_0368831 [Tanacetum coccineum]